MTRKSIPVTPDEARDIKQKCQERCRELEEVQKGVFNVMVKTITGESKAFEREEVKELNRIDSFRGRSKRSKHWLRS